jgi:phosphopantetheinyl transferase (holo-ACP synthase)
VTEYSSTVSYHATPFVTEYSSTVSYHATPFAMKECLYKRCI